MQVDAETGSTLVGRRDLLGLLVGAAVLAACGGGSSNHAPTSNGSAFAPSIGSLEDATVAVGDRIPEDRLAKWANRFAKTWKAAWKDDAGQSGIADGTLSIDVTKFTGTGELSIGDGILAAGSTIPAARYDVDLTKINYRTADPFHLSSPQLGEVEIAAKGFGAAQLVCTKIPGHPDIDRIDINLQAGDAPGTATVNYKITRGTNVTSGALAASAGPDRPPAPEPAAADSVQAFIDGTYAASLVSASDLSTAVGVHVHAPSANGGRANFSPGINVSNAIAETDDPNFTIQYSIYRATDPTIARTFLDLNKPIATAIDGLGDGAYLVNAPIFLQVLRGNEVAQITVAAPAGADLAALDRAVAETLLPKLGHA